MGEYVKYRNRIIKLGTMESLYYATLPKYLAAHNAGQLRWVEANLFPSSYLNVEHGFRFRFPFPDEDHLPLGEHLYEFNRSVPIHVSTPVFNTIMKQDHQGSGYFLAIEFQKPFYRLADNQLCNVVVFSDSVGMRLRRLEDDDEVKLLVKELVKNHIAKEVDLEKKKFYRLLGARILKGYRVETPAQKLGNVVNKIVEALDKVVIKPDTLDNSSIKQLNISHKKKSHGRHL